MTTRFPAATATIHCRPATGRTRTTTHSTAATVMTRFPAVTGMSHAAAPTGPTHFPAATGRIWAAGTMTTRCRPATQASHAVAGAGRTGTVVITLATRSPVLPRANGIPAAARTIPAGAIPTIPAALPATPAAATPMSR